MRTRNGLRAVGTGRPITREDAGAADERPRSSLRRFGWTFAFLWVLVATFLQLARQQGAPAIDTIWAEDGQLFLTDALRDPIGSIFMTAGGYVHLVPRLLAAAAATLPLDEAAVVFAVGSAVIVSLLSLFVFHASRELLPSLWARIALAGLIVLLPASGFESLSNSANIQYFFLFVAFWGLIHRPASLAGTLAGCMVVSAAALSTTIAVVLTPVAIWAFVRGEDRHRRTVAVTFLAGLALQAVLVFRAVVLDADPTLAQYPVRWSDFSPGDLVVLYGLRVVGAFIVGDGLVDEAWRSLSWLFAYGGLALLTALLVWGAWRADRKTRVWTGVTFAFSLGSFLMPVIARGTQDLEPVGDQFIFSGNRYVLAPMWFLATAILLVLGRTGISVRPVTRIGVPTVFLAILVGLAVANFSAHNHRSAGPRWSQELAVASQACGSRSPAIVEIPITPQFAAVRWRVTSRCTEL